MVSNSSGACKKLKKKNVNYDCRDMTYWTTVMKLFRFGIQPKKLAEDGDITLDEVVLVFGPKKANGYRSNNHDLDPKVKMQVEKLYSKFYPTNEKITNNEFGQTILEDCGKAKGCTYELGLSWFGGCQGESSKRTQRHSNYRNPHYNSGQGCCCEVGRGYCWVFEHA
jgi:hypothetical protein